MTNNKAETNRYTQTDRIQNPSSENLKCFTRDFFTRDFCSKNVLPGKNPGKLEKFTREKTMVTVSRYVLTGTVRFLETLLLRLDVAFFLDKYRYRDYHHIKARAFL